MYSWLFTEPKHKAKTYALKDDIIARGLLNHINTDNIELVSYADFVDLVVANQHISHW